MPRVLRFRVFRPDSYFDSIKGFPAFRLNAGLVILILMSEMARLIASGVLLICFCYFFHTGEQWKALSLQLAVLWLIFREARIRLQERSSSPPRRRK